MELHGFTHLTLSHLKEDNVGVVVMEIFCVFFLFLLLPNFIYLEGEMVSELIGFLAIYMCSKIVGHPLSVGIDS